MTKRISSLIVQHLVFAVVAGAAAFGATAALAEPPSLPSHSPSAEIIYPGPGAPPPTFSPTINLAGRNHGPGGQLGQTGHSTTIQSPITTDPVAGQLPQVEGAIVIVGANCARSDIAALVGRPRIIVERLRAQLPVRIFGPGFLSATYDYRPERLNVVMDHSRTVARAYCG